ncbi:hypothetical protein CDAR_598171 [Caerostris darwini]|uniref:Uncharacterized protein n=1 Tax=Caerostris darwini TaxID=1538125 RepID=A0AAV4QIT0_9ARAC|nr:hypothetical protein CDAR_598171 [Caerostris darwini]
MFEKLMKNAKEHTMEFCLSLLRKTNVDFSMYKKSCMVMQRSNSCVHPRLLAVDGSHRGNCVPGSMQQEAEGRRTCFTGKPLHHHRSCVHLWTQGTHYFSAYHHCQILEASHTHHSFIHSINTCVGTYVQN